MKQMFIAGMLLTATLSAGAKSYYDQLCEFNFNWKKYSMIAPPGDARSFETDADYVASHLSNVIPILKNNTTAGLSAEQRATRNQLIGLLDGYRLAGQFPLNHYRQERIPVFIDEHGTHCAVGYLMMRSGYEALAQRISYTDNYVWVKDITDPEALVWQQYSGFTMEELKLIQGAYDWYPPNAWISPDKYETPQMPICTTAYFDAGHNGDINLRKEERVWCKGEGNGKVINGKWEQNYAPGIPWIKGFFINGQRSGDWEEYYPGTKTLCRTESWRNNKLNGVRKRFDRNSQLIEEIIFVEGAAVCKMNYSLYDSLVYVRIPVNDSIVNTTVYNNTGKLIACGKERIYNPGGLLWFQNIELTALNSMQVSTRSTQMAMGTGNNSSFGQNGGYNTGSNGGSQGLFTRGGWEPALVEYHKIGTWFYYPARSEQYAAQHKGAEWYWQYQNYGQGLHFQAKMYLDVHLNTTYDSLHVVYDDDMLTDFIGFSKTEYTHFRFEYFTRDEYYANDLTYQQIYHPKITVDTNGAVLPSQAYINFNFWNWDPFAYETPVRKSAGQYNQNGERIGQWYYYTTAGLVQKKEEYLIPFKEEKLTAEENTASK